MSKLLLLDIEYIELDLTTAPQEFVVGAVICCLIIAASNIYIARLNNRKSE